MFIFLSGKLRCAVIIMSTLLLVSFFSKFYTVDKMVLRAIGLSFQQLPWLPFGTLGTHEYTVHSAAGSPAHLTTSLLPKACDILEQTPGRDPKDGCYGQVWPHKPRTERARRGNQECVHVRD